MREEVGYGEQNPDPEQTCVIVTPVTPAAGDCVLIVTPAAGDGVLIVTPAAGDGVLIVTPAAGDCVLTACQLY